MRRHPILLYTLQFASGFAGLGYQAVWTRMLSLGLGHELVAVLAVVAAFFCGLSLGGFLLDGPVSRSRRPGVWYTGLEVTIGLWGLALMALIPVANRLLPQLLGPEPSTAFHWAVAFLAPLLVLLPSTLAMGGTLPSAERLASRLLRSDRALGGVYAANTLGAMAGAMITTFYLSPQFGFATTLFILSAVNLICAAGIYFLLARGESERPDPEPKARRGARPWMVVLFVTGLLGVGYEVVAIRALSQVLENTVYSYASVLSVYLLGTALGAAAYHVRAPRGDFSLVLTRLLQAQALTGVLGTLALWRVEAVYLAVHAALGSGWSGAVAAELAAGGLVFLLPTFVMGAVFTHVSQALRRPDGGIGRAAGINTLGAAIAPLLFGVVLLPRLGVVLALLLISVIYIGLIPWSGWRAWLPSLAPLTAAAVLAVGPWSLDLLDVPPGGAVIESREGVMATVSVVTDMTGGTHLKVNNHFDMGGTASLRPDRRQAHLPLLLHSAPERALFLGLGTGATFAGAAYHPGLDAVGVELVPEVRPLLSHFRAVSGELAASERLRVRSADARRYVASTEERYDVIVADLFHPARDGAGTLYTREHFLTVRSKLAEGGVFCQWLPLFQLDLETMRLIVRTFLDVFPEASAYLADLSVETPLVGLVTRSSTVMDLEDRAADPRLAGELARVGYEHSVEVMGLQVAREDELRAFAGPGELNTDDLPRVVFGAPRVVYEQQGPPGERLLAFLEELGAEDTASGDRLSAYRAARDAFLRLGVQVDRRSGADEMARKLPGPLLRIVRMSSDFRPAYDPILAISQHLYARGRRDAARELLTQLELANPGRDEARQLRTRLFEEG
ncbi:MAG: fused MFS/spermidine synthase [Myxococcota bacterium]